MLMLALALPYPGTGNMLPYREPGTGTRARTRTVATDTGPGSTHLLCTLPGSSFLILIHAILSVRGYSEVRIPGYPVACTILVYESINKQINKNILRVPGYPYRVLTLVCTSRSVAQHTAHLSSLIRGIHSTLLLL